MQDHIKKALRTDTYNGLTDYMANQAELVGVPAGIPVILPSSFSGSPTAMHQYYQYTNGLNTEIF